jgi:hypothetical protein
MVPMSALVDQESWLKSEARSDYRSRLWLRRHSPWEIDISVGNNVEVVTENVERDAGQDCGLRMIVDQVAAATASGRACAAIDALRKRLESKDECLREEATGAAAFGKLHGQSPLLKLDVGRSTRSPRRTRRFSFWVGAAPGRNSSLGRLIGCSSPAS